MLASSKRYFRAMMVSAAAVHVNGIFTERVPFWWNTLDASAPKEIQSDTMHDEFTSDLDILSATTAFLQTARDTSLMPEELDPNGLSLFRVSQQAEESREEFGDNANWDLNERRESHDEEPEDDYSSEMLAEVAASEVDGSATLPEVATAAVMEEHRSETPADALTEHSFDSGNQAFVSFSHSAESSTGEIQKLDGQVAADQRAAGNLATGGGETFQEKKTWLFGRFDRDNDGFISKVELRVGNPFLSPPSMQRIVQTMDANTDGTISFQEFDYGRYFVLMGMP